MINALFWPSIQRALLWFFVASLCAPLQASPCGQLPQDKNYCASIQKRWNGKGFAGGKSSDVDLKACFPPPQLQPDGTCFAFAATALLESALIRAGKSNPKHPIKLSESAVLAQFSMSLFHDSDSRTNAQGTWGFRGFTDLENQNKHKYKRSSYPLEEGWPYKTAQVVLNQGYTYQKVPTEKGWINQLIADDKSSYVLPNQMDSFSMYLGGKKYLDGLAANKTPTVDLSEFKATPVILLKTEWRQMNQAWIAVKGSLAKKLFPKEIDKNNQVIAKIKVKQSLTPKGELCFDDREYLNELTKRNMSYLDEIKTKIPPISDDAINTQCADASKPVVQKILGHICQGVPVAAGLWTLGLETQDSTGKWGEPHVSEKIDSGHAMVIEGVETIDGKPFWIFRNSWGKNGSKSRIPMDRSCQIINAFTVGFSATGPR